MNRTTPDIQARTTHTCEVNQSQYDHVSRLLMRATISGPSGLGKTILLQSMLLDICKRCNEIIYIFSLSIYIDHTWNPVKH